MGMVKLSVHHVNILMKNGIVHLQVFYVELQLMDAFVGHILSCPGFIPQLGILGDVPLHFRQLLLIFGMSSMKSVELLGRFSMLAGLLEDPSSFRVLELPSLSSWFHGANW